MFNNNEDTLDANSMNFSLNSFNSPNEQIGDYNNEKVNCLNELGNNLDNRNTNEKTDKINILNNQNINFDLFDRELEEQLNSRQLLSFNLEENFEVLTEVKQIELNEDEEEKEENNKSIKIKDLKNKKQIFFIQEKKDSIYGRKTDIDKRNGKTGSHTKEDEDNIIHKIKSFFGKAIYKYLSSIIKGELLKLDININKCLKKDVNLNLFSKTLKEIYSETKISEKYKQKKVTTNEQLIKKIYEEKIENEAITILNLTYEEVFEIFRRNLEKGQKISDKLRKKIKGTHILNKEYFQDANVFIEKEEKIRKAKKENQENIQRYLNDIKRLILDFKNWFVNKIGRER